MTERQTELETLRQSLDEAEAQVAIYQNLYSTSLQLLIAKSPIDVLDIVGEVLHNLIGAKSYVIYAWRQGENVARRLRGKGAPHRTLSRDHMTEALRASRPTVHRRPG